MKSIPLLRKLKAYGELLRLTNCVIAAFAVIIGAFIINNVLLSWQAILFACLSAFFITAGGNAFNDYCDRDVDRENRPERPIPRGDITAKTALWFSAISFSLGLILPMFTLNPLNVGIAIIAVAALIAYSLKLKALGIPGNITTSILTGLLFVYGLSASATELSFKIFLTVFYMFLLAFLANLSREIIKGISDINGDLKHGIKTLAVAYGSEKTRYVAVSILIIAVAISPVLYYIGAMSGVYFAIVIIADVIFLVSALSIYLDFSQDNAKKIKDIVRMGMGVALLAFFFGLTTEMQHIVVRSLCVLILASAPFLAVVVSNRVRSKCTKRQLR